MFEQTHWWLSQIARMADEWLDDLFGDRRNYTEADFSQLYRTNLNIIGLPTDNKIQDIDDPNTSQGQRLNEPINLSQWFPERPYWSDPQFVRLMEIYYQG